MFFAFMIHDISIDVMRSNATSIEFSGAEYGNTHGEGSRLPALSRLPMEGPLRGHLMMMSIDSKLSQWGDRCGEAS